MKKLLVLLLPVFALALGQSQEYVNAANTLAGSGYIVNQSGDTGKYNVNNAILRQEAIGIITRVNGLVRSGDSGYICQNKFLDVSAHDGWVCYVAESAASRGVVNPNNAQFRPKDHMTRFEAMILAFKGSCMQPIDATNRDSAQDQVRNFALNTGLITNSSLDVNSLTTRGEFFTYIVRAQNYKVTRPEVIDASLPGCTSFHDINFAEISLKAPDNMFKLVGEGDGELEEYYEEYDTGAVLGLSVSRASGVTDIRMIASTIREIIMQEPTENNFLQQYIYKGGLMHIFTRQEPNTQLKVKGYSYSIIKNDYLYNIVYAVPIDSDKDTESIRNTIFNSVQIMPLQQ